MRDRFLGCLIAAVACAAAAHVITTVVVAQGQAPARPASPPTRSAGARPDLQGVWRIWNLAKYDLEDHGAKPGVPAGRGFVVDPADGRIPYKPEALAKRDKNYAGTKDTDPWKNSDPLAKCYLPGIPRMTYLGWPFQIIQTPDAVTFVYEWSHKKRVVPINSTVPVPKDETAWMGMARGRYEGNSLVVTLTNFNSYTWFDMAGNYHSDALQVVERYTPVNADTLRYEATMTDPKVFTRPWTIRMTIERQKDVGILDYECTAMLDELGIHHTWPRDFDEEK
jgi:hypothetical protein